MTRVRMLAAALAAFLVPSFAQAQASAPPTRADVKAETRAAEKGGKLTPAGEGATPTSGTPAKGSTKTRAERKSETRAEAKARTLTPAGETVQPTTGTPGKGTTKTRAERKAETAEARKKGELVPAGEGPGAPKK